MNSWQTLVDGILDEDGILRRRLATVQPPLLDKRGPDASLSAKEMLAHVAFWDVFTVRFFEEKLRGREPAPPADFARKSEQAIREAVDLTFAEVEGRYRQATENLITFLSRHWDELTPKQQRDFQVPLKHRRHHRRSLFRALDAMTAGDPDSEQAAEA